MGEEAGHQRRRRRAVDVVVAEHGNRLPLLDRVGEPRRGGVHVAHAARVGHQRFESGIEHHGHVVERHAAPGQHAPQQLRQSVPLADRGGAQLRLAGEPLAPLIAARRRRDAQERRRGCRRLPPFAHRAHDPALDH